MEARQEPSRVVRILVPPSWTNDQKGDFFENIAGRLLKKQRFKVVQRVRFTGMEIDLIADNIDTQQRAFVECKFERHPLSANVIDLLIGKAVRKGVATIYLFSTAPPGKEAKGVIDELKDNRLSNQPVFAFVGPDDIAEMFIDVYGAEPPSHPGTEHVSISSTTLVITPNVGPFWVLEEHRDGVPVRAYLEPVRCEPRVSFEDMKSILTDHKVCEGLDFVSELRLVEGAAYVENGKAGELITQVPVADSLDDYRPCQPEYFVGRYDVQKRIWEFLNRVRANSTSTRTLALSSPSGFGKSSVVLKLADRFRNQKWMRKIYLFPVDVRSARGPLFVAKAMRTAIQAAIDDGFIPEPTLRVTIESTESFLQSKSVNLALDALRQHKRVLVVFFDQFEELFTKDELLSTFESFKRLAFEVHSASTNLVVGFSWRTGITLSDDNPAYHMWHDLRDLRMEISLDEFTSAESSQLVGTFERELSQTLLRPLRRRLLEQGQGVPWLLKKLCIHVYREIKHGVDQEELVSRRLNVKSLFDEDLAPLAEQQTQCLRYIAENSPADSLDIYDRFHPDTVNQLYSRRLVVRAGQKYAVYWDIFRDYLLEGIIPAIPWTYVPSVQMSMALRAFLLIRQKGPLELRELAVILGYAEKTAMNIVCDLQNLLLAGRDENRRYYVRPDLLEAEIEEVAQIVLEQMKDHVVIQALHKSLVPGESMTHDEFEGLVGESYASASRKQRTMHVYVRRLLPWFRFVGLIDVSDNRARRPQGPGQEFGKFDISRLDRAKRGRGVGSMFMCSSSPKRVLGLAQRLVKEGSIERDDIYRQHNRNAASDLASLGLAAWEGSRAVPTDALLDAGRESQDAICRAVISRALATPFIHELRRVLAANPSGLALQVGRDLSEKLGRTWSDASAKRYANAGRRWLRFFGVLGTESGQPTKFSFHLQSRFGLS